MIKTTGIVKFPNSTLICYDSPRIEITGQRSNRANINLLYVDLAIKDISETTYITESTTIDTSVLKTVSDENSIGASYMVDNLYTMLEPLLIETLQLINPNTTFEVV